MNSSEVQEQVYAQGISHHLSLLNTFLQTAVNPGCYPHNDAFQSCLCSACCGNLWQREKKISINLCYVLHITLEAWGTHLKETKNTRTRIIDFPSLSCPQSEIAFQHFEQETKPIKKYIYMEIVTKMTKWAPYTFIFQFIIWFICASGYCMSGKPFKWEFQRFCFILHYC